MKGFWSNGDVHSIGFVGNNVCAKGFIKNLVNDFEEPKFGYNGELWDEDEDDEDLWDKSMDEVDELDLIVA